MWQHTGRIYSRNFLFSLSFCQPLRDKYYFTIFAFMNSYTYFYSSIQRNPPLVSCLFVRPNKSNFSDCRAHLINWNFLALKLSRSSRLSARCQIFASSYTHIYIMRACIIIPASLSQLRIDTFSCRPTGRDVCIYYRSTECRFEDDKESKDAIGHYQSSLWARKIESRLVKKKNSWWQPLVDYFSHPVP